MNMQTYAPMRADFRTLSAPIRNTAFGEFIVSLAPGESNREIARRAGVNATTIGDMKWGTVPSPSLLSRFADGMALTGEQRERLFRLAGQDYETELARALKVPAMMIREPRAEYTPDLMTINVSARDLLPEDEAEIQRHADALRERRRSERGEG